MKPIRVCRDRALPGYPFPTGVACVADGGNVPNGPCLLGFLPPAFCAGPGTALNANRMLQHYGPCARRRLPAMERPFSWSSMEQETTTVCSSRPSTILPITSPRRRISRGPTASRTTTQRHSASSLRRNAVPYDRKFDRGNCPNADTHIIFNQSLVAETPKFSNHMDGYARRPLEILLIRYRAIRH